MFEKISFMSPTNLDVEGRVNDTLARLLGIQT